MSASKKKDVQVPQPAKEDDVDPWADPDAKKEPEVPKEKPVDTEVFDLNKQIATLRNELTTTIAKEGGHGGEGEEKEEVKQDDEVMKKVLTPAERAAMFYDRAKAFYTNCSGSSLELEIVTRDVVAASAYADDLKLYYFLAKIFKQNLDYSSSIYALRNALRLDHTYKPARKLISEVLLLRGREIMGEATIANEQLNKAKKITKAMEKQREEMEEAKKKEKAKLARIAASKKVAAVLQKGGDTPADTGPGDDQSQASQSPVKEAERPSFMIPRKFEAHVNLLYKSARVHFDECLEYDRDNHHAIIFKGVCHVQASELNEAMETLVRAGHLVNVHLKHLYPVKKMRYTSAGAIENSKKVLSMLSRGGEGAAAGAELKDDGDASAAAAAATGGPASKGGADHDAMAALDKGGTQYIYNDSFDYASPEAAEESKVLTRKLAEISILKAKIYWGQGLNENGNEEMRKASVIIPNHPEIKKFGVRSYVRAEKVYTMCVKKFRDGELEEANNLIANAIALSSQDVKLYVMQAKILRNMDRTESAFTSVQRATNLYQQAGEGQYELRIPEEIIKETNLIFNDKALECAAKGDYDRSVSLLNRAIQAEINLNRNNTKYNDMLGSLHKEGGVLGATGSGGAGAGHGLTTDGSSVGGMSGRGDAGMGLLERVDYRFLLNRGDCLRAQHKYGLALIDYDAAMANLKLNKLGASSGVAGARREWNVATRLSLTHYLVATDYFNENAYEDAEVQLSLAVEYNPKVSEYYHARGRARYYTGRHQEAYEDYKACYSLDPNNQEVLLRLKQFEANHPGVAVATSVAAAGAPTPNTMQLEGKRKKEEGMTLAQARNDHRSVPPIPTTDDDKLAALLHAQHARSLPEVAAQLKAQREIKAAIPVKRLAGESGNPEDRFWGHDVLPLLNPNLTMAAVLGVDRDRKSSNVRRIIDSKYDTSKGTLWTAFSNAQKSAKLVSRPAPNAEHAPDDGDDDMETVVSVGGTARRKPKSYTVNGLKRWSQKQTDKALRDGGLIKGVITHSNDPFIKALEAEGGDEGGSGGGAGDSKSKSKPFVINVSSKNARSSKWGGGGGGGEVESFESVDQRAELLAESKGGGWRLKLRAEQEKREKEMQRRRMDATSRLYSSKGKTEEELKEEARRLAQVESTSDMTMTAEAKRQAKKDARMSRKKRGKKKRRNDPNAPREGPLTGAGTADVGDGSEFESEGGEDDEERQKAHLTADRQSSNIAALLAQAGVDEASQWGSMFGGDGAAGGGIVHDEENESSLIAMTEEEELQLAYEQRVKAEHEEARKKRQERREQILKKNSLSFLSDEPKQE